jgi:integrase
MRLEEIHPYLGSDGLGERSDIPSRSFDKDRQERLVPITATLRRELQRHRSLDGVTRIQGLVFHKDGRKLRHTYREVRRLCEEQKIEDFIFHDLWHCVVTNLADAGVDTETIMKIVGHSSVEMFLRYRTVKAEKLDAAISSLNTLITRRLPAVLQISDIAAW